MQHILRFLTSDDGRILLEEHTIAYGLASGYERSAAALGLPAARQVLVELLDDTGHLLDRRTYRVPAPNGLTPMQMTYDTNVPEPERGPRPTDQR